MKYEWDTNKNFLNIKKHGLSFEESVLAFSDKDHLSIYDKNHAEGEDRWILLAQIPYNRYVVVVFTYRKEEELETIRIISARMATKKETDEYYKRQAE
ncbi:MAG: BrnT family toxin [Brevinematales bacterium]|nr:BrnT family toxin [Brevinematales bacterium]